MSTGILPRFTSFGGATAGVESPCVVSVAAVAGCKGKLSGTGGGSSTAGLGLAGGDVQSAGFWFWLFLFFFFAMLN
jgi:hypothetical protein